MANYRSAKETIDYLLGQLKDTDFFKYLSDVEYTEEMKEKYCNNFYEFYDDNSLIGFFERGDYSDSIHYAYGASKIVVWDDMCDYVMKISKTDKDDQYCKKEAEVYDEACKWGAEDAFAWCAEIYPAGVFGNRGIYAMEYVDCNECEINDCSYDYAFHNYCDNEGLDPTDDEVIDKYNDYFWRYEDDLDTLWDWATDGWSSYVRWVVYKLIDKFNLNDFHAGNWGFIGNKVVLVDYSGW